MKHLALALPFAALFAALPAQAQTNYSSTASISNIRYTLTDLDLNDGVTPYLMPALYLDHGSSTFGARYWDHDDWQEQEDTRDVSFYDQQTIAFDTVRPGEHSKHLQVTANISGTSLDTMAISNTATVSGSGQGGTFSDIILRRNFTLSPNTLLTISLDVNTSSDRTGEEIAGYGDAYAFVRVDDKYTHFAHHSEIPAQWPGQNGGQQTFNTTIQTGNWEHWINTELWVRATAGVSEISPVPEPQTYAMLLAGLGLIGWRLARSRQAG
ncbi:MAG TPA: PEP-CTERM sorting domain-containing protein [Telluria sp.]|jgi:hypothetical protein